MKSQAELNKRKGKKPGAIQQAEAWDKRKKNRTKEQSEVKRETRQRVVLDLSE